MFQFRSFVVSLFSLWTTNQNFTPQQEISQPKSIDSETPGAVTINGQKSTSFNLQTVIYTCPAYSASNTNYAQQYYATCSFTACEGTTFVATSCGTCTGDQEVRLYQGSTYVAYDDDSSCGVCSTLSYTVSGLSSTCYTYSLREGCYGSGSCTGQFTVSTATPSPTYAPYAYPTYAPHTSYPTYAPHPYYPTYAPFGYPVYHYPTPTPTLSPATISGNTDTTDDNGVYILTTGAIAGIVVGSFLCAAGFMGGAAILMFYFCYRQRPGTTKLSTTEYYGDEEKQQRVSSSIVINSPMLTSFELSRHTTQDSSAQQHEEQVSLFVQQYNQQVVGRNSGGGGNGNINQSFEMTQI